jgi:hypothetical protein
MINYNRISWLSIVSSFIWNVTFRRLDSFHLQVEPAQFGSTAWATLGFRRQNEVSEKLHLKRKTRRCITCRVLAVIFIKYFKTRSLTTLNCFSSLVETSTIGSCVSVLSKKNKLLSLEITKVPVLQPRLISFHFKLVASCCFSYFSKNKVKICLKNINLYNPLNKLERRSGWHSCLYVGGRPMSQFAVINASSTSVEYRKNTVGYHNTYAVP